EFPANGYSTGSGGNRTELCRICCELMEHHRECLTQLGTQHDIRSIDQRIVSSGIGREFVTDEVRKRNAAPTRVAQQLMRGCHRFDAAFDCSDKVSHRATCLLCARGDCQNKCKYIFYAVVEFRDKSTLMIFQFFALGDVTVMFDDIRGLSHIKVK